MKTTEHTRRGEASEGSAPFTTIGIAGGGQLAQMMLPAAARLGLEVVVLDPDPDCSASAGARETVVGAFDSAPAIRELAARSDVVTYEIERIDAGCLADLEREGMPVRPSAAVLAVIQDKLAQKDFLVRNRVPTSDHAAFDATRPPPLPFVWKARRDGYDGRGVSIVRTTDDLAALPDVPALTEALIDIERELAILVARDAAGTIVHYPVVEIVMDAKAHVMDQVVAPAEAPATIEQQCREIAGAIAEAFDYVGLLAIEFFVTRSGAVLVNELSPRPHNSGHYTIEACATSQFEQHLRAVAGLPLGSAALVSPAVTRNVLGEPGAHGTPRNVGFERTADGASVFVHDYAKPEVRPGRKMAHVTVLAPTRAEALARAAALQGEIRVEGTVQAPAKGQLNATGGSNDD